MAIVVEHHGPVFDWRRELILREFLDQTKKAIAERGVKLLMLHGRQFFRYEHSPRTGVWEGGLAVDPVVADRVIHDDVVYNSWLEGVSERNQASRFKGYRLWRLTTQELDRDKYVIAEMELQRGMYLERLNGI